MISIKYKKTRKDAIVPTQAKIGDAGYDLYSLESIAIPAHCVIKIDTGLAFEIPEGYVGLIWDRSGMGSKGYKIHGGVVDSSYRGTIGVLVSNTSNDIKYIHYADRIAQILFQKIEQVEFLESENLSETTRSIEGFGSTGN